MPITVLPTRTDGSLGETKEDPGRAVASKYQLKLDPEWNLAADCIVEAMARLGLTGSSTSLEYILDRLGNGSPRYFRHTDHFRINGAGTPDSNWWQLVVGAWSVVDTPGGCASGLLDDATGGAFQDWGYLFLAEHLPRMSLRVTMGSIHADAAVPKLQMLSAAGNDGWYLTYDSAVNAKWQLVTLVGGASTTYNVGPDVVAGVELEVDVQVFYDAALASYDLQVSVGGIPITLSGVGLAAGIPWGRRFSVGAGGVGAAGTTILLRRLVTEADFGA